MTNKQSVYATVSFLSLLSLSIFLFPKNSLCLFYNFEDVGYLRSAIGRFKLFLIGLFEDFLVDCEAVAGHANHKDAGVDSRVIFNCIQFLIVLLLIFAYS